jgi:Xaa-Pro dipeptidase
MEARGLDAICLSPGANLYYLTGFATEAYERLTVAFIPAADEPVLVVPKLDEQKAHQDAAVENVIGFSDAEDPVTVLRTILQKLRLETATVGVEDHMPFRTYSQLIEAAPNLRAVRASALLFQTRLRKSGEEIELLKRAGAIVDQGFKAAVQAISPGITELEAASKLEYDLKKLGGEKVPFCVVLGGPNSALPHGNPSERRFKIGDLVVMDFSATYRGYFADITRMVSMGQPNSRQKEVFETVLSAEQSAVENVKPGKEAGEIDAVARGIIRNRGFGQYFVHRTGHGLGLEVHEKPDIVEGSKEILERGMVFTVEPGIYLPGDFGARVEDDVVVTAAGLELITNSPRTLVVV